jgi:hypothetical protein
MPGDKQQVLLLVCSPLTPSFLSTIRIGARKVISRPNSYILCQVPFFHLGQGFTNLVIAREAQGNFFHLAEKAAPSSAPPFLHFLDGWWISMT